MAQNVTVYTSNTCAYCHALKEFFEKKQVDYNEVNVDEEPDRRQEVLDISGQMAVPVTLITQEDGGKQVAVGFNASKLSSALGLS